MVDVESLVIENWVIGECLGEGFSGAVFRAQDIKKKTYCAMKIVNVETLHSRFLSLGLPVDIQLLSAKVEVEAKVLALLSHPTIVQLQTAFRICNNIFICMELVEGQSLLNHITVDGMEVDAARGIFRQLMKAVYYCRRNNVIHGDIKLENILMNHKGELKLIDFGFSHFVIPGEQFEVLGGTAAYSPPESFMSFGWDVWSSGVVLYLLLFGCFPFSKEERDTGSYQFQLHRPIPDSCYAVLVNIFQQQELRTSARRLLQSDWLYQNPSSASEETYSYRTDTSSSLLSDLSNPSELSIHSTNFFQGSSKSSSSHGSTSKKSRKHSSQSSKKSSGEAKGTSSQNGSLIRSLHRASSAITQDDPTELDVDLSDTLTFYDAEVTPLPKVDEKPIVFLSSEGLLTSSSSPSSSSSSSSHSSSSSSSVPSSSSTVFPSSSSSASHLSSTSSLLLDKVIQEYNSLPAKSSLSSVFTRRSQSTKKAYVEEIRISRKKYEQMRKGKEGKKGFLGVPSPYESSRIKSKSEDEVHANLPWQSVSSENTNFVKRLFSSPIHDSSGHSHSHSQHTPNTSFPSLSSTLFPNSLTSPLAPDLSQSPCTPNTIVVPGMTPPSTATINHPSSPLGAPLLTLTCGHDLSSVPTLAVAATSSAYSLGYLSAGQPSGQSSHFFEKKALVQDGPPTEERPKSGHKKKKRQHCVLTHLDSSDNI